MNIDRFISAYNKIKTSEEMDDEILAVLCLKKQNQGKGAGSSKRIRIFRKRRFLMRTAVAIASVALVIGVFQIPSINAAANELLSQIQYRISWNGGKYDVKLGVDAVRISENAPKERIKMDNLREVETCLGVRLLFSPLEYQSEENYQVEYDPYVDKDGRFLRLYLKTDSYAWLGNSNTMKIETYEDPYRENMIIFDPEPGTRSPIGLEVAIHVDPEKTVISDGDVIELDSTPGYEEIEKYHIEALDIDALVLKLGKQWAGSAAWDQSKTGKGGLVEAEFTYYGIEYRYYGYISMDKMKDFLETLSMEER